jgi:CBS domain-containing protein
MHVLSGLQEEADMGLLRLAHVPPPIVEPEVSVLEAVHVMARDAVGAVVVVKNGELLGIFTERDLMLRVVKPARTPETTLVSDVMTGDVDTITQTSTSEEAVNVMLIGHLRHLPILAADGKVLGLLSIRALLEEKLQDLNREVSSLEQYMANDGPGG